jgi:hypothetical protein
VTQVDAETLTVQHLQSATTVTGLAPATDISTKLRRGWVAGDPAVRVRRIGGLTTEDVAAHLGRYRLQVEAFAGTELAAFTLASAAFDALRALAGQANDFGVVTAVGNDLGLTNSPDPDSDSARYLFGVVLYAHAPIA